MWSLRCDIHILDDSGNVIDAATLATVSKKGTVVSSELIYHICTELSSFKWFYLWVSYLCLRFWWKMSALHHFRLPEVSVMESNGVMVHHSFDKEPGPLPIHHTPICVTFGLFEEVS